LADLAEAAARLCKADLVTEMVGEFPELQGLMGGYYARAEGLPDEVADAIRDHYKPVGQGDDVPTAPVTVAVSLADKLDTLFAFFAWDMLPTGSKDPFALRRAAIAVVSMLVEFGIRLPLQAAGERTVWQAVYNRVLMDHAYGELFLSKWFTKEQREDENFALWLERSEGGLWNHSRLEARDVALMVFDFLADRLKVQQREAGVRHDLIDAVFALGGEDDLVRLLARVHALQAFITTEDGANLLAGYKRAANILKKTPLPEGEGLGVGGATSDPANPHPQPLPLGEGAQELAYTPEPAEQALIDALAAAAPRAAEAVEQEQFADAMAALATLRSPIDRFFDEVTVNAPDAEKRAARLALLARFRDAVHRVADFSRIEG
jgi:glycyl-tRNA synthetase beta chain